VCDAEGWGVGWGVLGAVGGHSMVCEAGDAGGVICDVAHDGVGLLGAVECCSVGCEAGDSAGAISDMATGKPGSSHVADGWALIWGILGSCSMAISTALVVYDMAVG